MEIRKVTEERRGNVPLFVHPDWDAQFAWLMQGVTPRAAGNFASFGHQTAGTLQQQWNGLRSAVGACTAVIGRQIHGAVVLKHGALSPGLMLAADSDGQLSDVPGNLLAVTIADCVPVFVVDPQRQVVAVLHAGWRGTVAGIMRACTEIMGTEVLVHLGPAICGDCYEVGPEVHVALELPEPQRNSPVDLRAALGRQCVALGIESERITTSSWCTRCGDSPFYSHRAGHPERQVGVIGIR